MAIERMFWAPLLCCVHPRAYIDVITLSGADVSATIVATLRYFSPRSAADAFDQLRCVNFDMLLQQFHTQRGCSSVMSIRSEASPVPIS